MSWALGIEKQRSNRSQSIVESRSLPPSSPLASDVHSS